MIAPLNTLMEYGKDMSLELIQEIKLLAAKCGMHDPIIPCEYTYCWIRENEIVAVIAFREVTFSGGSEVLQWQHIFFHPKVRRTRDAYTFAMDCMRRIELVDKQIWMFIEYSKGGLNYYAEKFGFKEYAANEEGIFLTRYKNEKDNLYGQTTSSASSSTGSSSASSGPFTETRGCESPTDRGAKTK